MRPRTRIRLVYAVDVRGPLVFIAGVTDSNDTKKPDLLEARREFERIVIRDAYDYALATLGCSREGSHVVRMGKADAAVLLDHAQAKLLDSARMLAAALVVDARQAELGGLDRILGPYGREHEAVRS